MGTVTGTLTIECSLPRGQLSIFRIFLLLFLEFFQQARRVVTGGAHYLRQKRRKSKNEKRETKNERKNEKGEKVGLKSIFILILCVKDYFFFKQKKIECLLK